MELLTPTIIIRSKRRSISLVINNKGEFIVRAPLRALNSEIMAFINKKRDWIITKRTEMLKQRQNFALDLSENSEFKIFDDSYIIKYNECNFAKISNNYLILPIKNLKKH